MRPVSAAFLAEVRGSHRVRSEAWCHPADGSDPVEVPLTEGSVTLDATQRVRGQCDFSVADTDWIPRDATDRLSPFGTEIELRRGVYLSDGSWETVGLGRFGLEDAEVTDEGSGASVRIAALDRMERLSKAKFEDVFQVANGTRYTQAILDVVLGIWPECPVMDGFVDMSTMTSTLRPTAQVGDDPAEFVQGLAFAVGMSLFFDGEGVLTLRKFASLDAVWELVEGDGLLLSVARSWSRTAAFNRVVVSGENTEGTDVYRAVASDDDPLSPTFYGGPFGKVPEFRSFPQVQSNGQAQDVANNILAREIGAPSTVSFGMVPNPALEPDDTIRISRSSVGVDEEHVIDRLTVGLGASEVMSGQTRERRSF